MFQNNLLMAAASAAGGGGITVDNSVIFNDDDSPRMTRTPAIAGNRLAGSLSLWYKRCNLGSIMQLFNAGAGDDITFNASDKLTFTDSSGVSYITTQVFRDTTAWGHLLFAWDTTLATAGDRLRIYHNGTEITAFDTETNPSQNDQFEISNTVQQAIGANENGNEEFDGYLSQVHYIDGNQHTPTSFGGFDTNNVWRPIEYTASSTAASISFLQRTVDTSNATVYTFSGQNLGAAATDRVIVCFALDGTGTGTPSSVTIGGVAASLVLTPTTVRKNTLWYATVPTGTSGDVVVTSGSAQTEMGIALWRLTGTGGPYDFGQSDANPGTTDISVPAGGVALAGMGDGGYSHTGYTWTGLTEDFDENIGVTNTNWSGASATNATAQDLTITATPAHALSNSGFQAVSFGPSDASYGTNGFFLNFSDANNLGLDANGTVSTTDYRYLKLDVTGLSGSTTYVSLGELEYFEGTTLYPTQTMTSNTLPSPLVASASEDTGTGSGLAYLAFDDNINTHWQTANGTVTGWLKIDLGSGNGIAPDRIVLGTAETPDRTPSTFTIQGSNNDSDWTTIATYSNMFSQVAPPARVKYDFPIGSGNNFLTQNFTTTDQVTDTPTKNYAILNTLANGRAGSGNTLSNGNLTIERTTTGWDVTCSTFPATKKTYWEVLVNDNYAFLMGLSREDNTLGATSGPGGTFGAGLQTNEVFNQGSVVDQTNGTSRTFPIVSGDVVNIAFDPARGAVWYGLDGTWKDGTASSASSATILAEIEGSGTTYAILTGFSTSDVWFPMISMYATSGANNSLGTARFNEADFGTAAPSGYVSQNTSNLDIPTIPDGTAYFQTTLYTGNASVRNIDQTGNSTFQPDMVWIKNRSAADPHMLIDAARGVTKELNPNSYIPESTDANGLTSFDSDGFGLGTGAGGYNDNDENFIAWQWLAGGGAGSSNEVGTINTITTTVNTTSGVSIGTYTGTGSAGTIGHGLGAVPEFVVCKEASSDGVGGQWFTYHVKQNATPEDFYLILDEAQRAVDNSAMWNDTAPTSTVFSIGNDGDINESGQTYLCLAMAPVVGFSKFGSYTGNANEDGPFIYTGFKPNFVICKPIVDTTNWMMKSAALNPYNLVETVAFVNTASAPETGNQVDFLSNGFKIRTTSAINQSSTTIVYMAFAEYPFGGEDVTPSTTF